MLNPKVGRMWIEALRSGAYTQAKTALHRDGEGHCCLGVLCDLVAPERWGVPNSGGVVCHGDHTGSPPRDVLQAAGLLLEEASALAFMNDGGKSFEFIADYIESNLMGGSANG